MVEEKYYGQFGQDKWVIEDIFNFKNNGFFVELAAGDGIDLSNSYILEKKYGWKGICIEANDELFEKLKSNRKCICLNACIDDEKDKKVKFTRNAERGGLHGGIIDIDTDNKDSDDFIWKTTTTLKDVLIKNNVPKIIDYFSLDVEGAEYRILKNFPFDEYIFLAMNIERPCKELIALLEKKGYIKVGSIVNDGKEIDKLFVHKNIIELK